MGFSGTNNGGGARWHTMPRATCPCCGLTRPVGVFQAETNYVCNNRVKCDERKKRRREREREERKKRKKPGK